MSKEGPDLRLAVPVACFWGGAWIAPLLPSATGLGLAAVGGLLTIALVRRSPWWFSVAVLMAAAGLASVTFRVVQLESGTLAEWSEAHRTVEMVGVLTSDPDLEQRLTFGGTPTAEVHVELRASAVEAGGIVQRTRAPILVVGPGEGWTERHVGEEVRLSGSLRPVDHTAPLAAILFSNGAPELVHEAPAPLRAAESMRSGLRTAAAGLPTDPRGLIPALVVGDESQLPPILVSDLRDAGLSHLTAVSGANVAIVVGVGLLLARWVRVRGTGLVAVGLGLVVWFVLLARPQPSVLRAAVMGVLALMAITAAGHAQAFRSLLAGVLLLLVADPWLARSWGFALSVAATGGLVLLARRWSRSLPGHLPWRVRDAVAVCLAAQVATLPLVVALSGQVAVLSVLANLLAAPAVAPTTVLGAAAAAVSPVWPQGAEALAWAAQWPAGWIAAVAHHVAMAPLATVSWPDRWLGAASAVVVLLAVGGLVALARRNAWWRRLSVVVAAGVVVATVGYAMGPGRWPPAGWVLVACDVGQGDALVANLGQGAAVVFDAGPDPVLVDRCLDRLGIEEIPLLVLTHFHADHVVGLPGVLEGRHVGTVLVSPLADPKEQADAVAGQTAGMAVTSARPGQTGSWGPASWRVLWPAELIRGQGSDPNNASVVIVLEVSGVRLLLTGDVEPAAQRALLATGTVPAVDVLKVPHHGSGNQDEDFLAATGATIALVSVGVDNPYGHPDPGTLSLLEAEGMLVGRTDQQGSLAVVRRDGELRLVTEG